MNRLNNENQSLRLKFKISEIYSLWENFYDKHIQLYEFTCDEYSALLESDMDKIESSLDKKNELIFEIKMLDKKREEISTEISTLLNNQDTVKLSELLTLLKNNHYGQEASELEKINHLLIDIIDKIQYQNKKNQLFLNKAILSLRELKESFGGVMKSKTYGPDGTMKNTRTQG